MIGWSLANLRASPSDLMSSQSRLASPIDAPVTVALVLVCEKCGKRARHSDKNPSHQLASKIKRLGKSQFERGAIRTVLTSCLDVWPEDRVMVSIVPTGIDAATCFMEADIEDIEATGRAVIKAIQRSARKKPVAAVAPKVKEA